MKLPKLPDLKPVGDALRRKWLAALIVFAFGIVLGVAVAVGKLGMPPSYEAISSVRIGTYAVTGVDLPCTATTMPTLATSQTFVKSAVPAPDFTVRADLGAPDVLRMHVVGGDPDTVKADATGRATAMVAYCQAETKRRYKAYNFALAALKDQRQNELGWFDRTLIPADAQKQQLADLTKKRDELQKQRDTLDTQAISQKIDASTKQSMQSAFEPVVVRDIQQNDSGVKTLQALVDKDTVAVTTMKAQYVATYPGLIAAQHRLDTDTAELKALQSAAGSAALPASNPTYLAMDNSTKTAQGLAAASKQQLDEADNKLAALNKAVDDQKAVVAAAELRIASATRHKAELLKAYQAMSAQFNTALAQETQIPEGGPVMTLADAVDPVNLTARLAAILGALVVLLFALLAVLTALALTALDRRLLTVAQITKLYGKPVISTLRPKGQ